MVDQIFADWTPLKLKVQVDMVIVGKSIIGLIYVLKFSIFGLWRREIWYKFIDFSVELISSIFHPKLGRLSNEKQHDYRRFY